MAVPSENEGMEALHLLKSTEPPTWLVPSDSLANATRTASHYFFSRLQPHVPKSPFDRLLVQGFDAEQIWQQLDLQSQPLLSTLSRQVKQWEKNPEELIGMFPRNVAVDVGKKKVLEDESERKELYDEEEDDVDMDDFDDDDEEEDENGEEGDREEEKESGGEEETGGKGGVEDEFLKIKDLQEFLEEDEAREYGLDRKTKKKKSADRSSADEEEDDDNEDEEEEEQGQDDDDEDELGIYGEGDDEDDDLGTARYEDFFGAIKKTTAKGRSKLIDEFEEESESGDEQDVGDINEEKNGELSTHEKQLQKLQLEIERMERENLEAKHWTMQGEVTAANRPENSALGEVLDFERKVRPPVEISKEFTASLEEMIKNRIIKGQFDDIERIASVPSKGPRERKELDDNKSKKGLAEVYEEEYVQKTNPAAAPSSFTDEQKKEASMLFKKLCLKLDALSHFHFAPKPVIEDMSIQANVPALAMEEIATTAVSDAAMLAPEEVFSGKGDIKDKAELTQAERKRRRANKKRKFKSETAKRMAKKPRDSTLENDNDGEEEK